MNKLIDSISSLFKPTKLLPAGVYHFQSPPDGELQYRLHLRVAEDGTGTLIINASTILHLNQTATEFAYHLIQKSSIEDTARFIASRYQISREDARLDAYEFRKKINTLIETRDLDPVTVLDISRQDPYSGDLSAPYRLDCALTYQLPEKSNPDLAPLKRVDRELSTQEWFTIIARAWDLGIPHLIFTGGEPTLREDLIPIIKKAEENGQVTGLLTDGYRFIDGEYRQALLQSGLDHLLFALSPLDKESWIALQAILSEDLFTTVHITINLDILKVLPQTIDQCRQYGANGISLSISDPENPTLSEALEKGRSMVAEADLPLKWDLPVPYSIHNPISKELEIGQESTPGAGNAWFYIEPDGDILPSQGINEVLGNMLNPDWRKIWEPVVED
jgi:hypothetical protein